MRAWPRTRKTAKWGGLALVVVLLAAWAMSLDGYAHWRFPNGLYGVVSSGGLQAGKSGPPEDPSDWGLTIRRFPTRRVFWRPMSGSDRWSSFLFVPLWIPGAPLLAATVLAWCLDARARRRAIAHLCSRCGYDRAGLTPSSPCPECNTPAPAPASASK